MENVNFPDRILIPRVPAFLWYEETFPPGSNHGPTDFCTGPLALRGDFLWVAVRRGAIRLRGRHPDRLLSPSLQESCRLFF